jgi:hypothetical protein
MHLTVSSAVSIVTSLAHGLYQEPLFLSLSLVGCCAVSGKASLQSLRLGSPLLSGLKKGATQADLRIEERGEAFSG